MFFLVNFSGENFSSLYKNSKVLRNGETEIRSGTSTTINTNVQEKRPVHCMYIVYYSLFLRVKISFEHEIRRKIQNSVCESSDDYCASKIPYEHTGQVDF